MVINTIFPSDASSNPQIKLTTHHKQKKGLYWQVRIHTKRQTLADDQVMWFATKSRETKNWVSDFCCLADGSLWGISYFMEWFVNWFMDSSIFPTEPDARNAQKGAVLSTAGGESTRRSRNSRQNQEVKWPIICGGAGSIDEEQEGNSEKNNNMKSCFDVVTLHIVMSGLPAYDSNRTHQK